MINDLQDSLSKLSQRELEVLVHLAQGHTYKNIARRMGLSLHTVDTYVRRIRGKTGVTNRVELTVLAAAAGHGARPESAAGAES
ncbi:response regulator transcription factor [Streptomyces avermitilis]